MKKITSNKKQENIIQNQIVCPNAKCITNNENMETMFYDKKIGGLQKFLCRFCEKSFTEAEVTKK